MSSGIYADDPPSDAEVRRIFEACRTDDVNAMRYKVACMLQAEFGFRIPPEDYKEIRNMGDAMVYVARRLEEERD